MYNQLKYNQDLEYTTSAQIDAIKFQKLEQEKQKLEQRCRQIELRTHEWANRVEQYRLKLLPEPTATATTEQSATILVKFTSVSLTGKQHTYRRRFSLDASAQQLFCFVYSSGMVDDPNSAEAINDEFADIIDNVDIKIRDAVGTIQYNLADGQDTTTIRELLGEKNIALVVVQEPVINRSENDQTHRSCCDQELNRSENGLYKNQQTIIDLTDD
jgi:hypothetical protein